jgi:hypothetical protein
MPMNTKRCIAIVLAIVCCAVGRASGQQPTDGADEARNAFPVPATVRVVRDLVYAEYGERRLKLDLYLPPEFVPFAQSVEMRASIDVPVPWSSSRPSTRRTPTPSGTRLDTFLRRSGGQSNSFAGTSRALEPRRVVLHRRALSKGRMALGS